jgi:hypothetical protein
LDARKNGIKCVGEAISRLCDKEGKIPLLDLKEDMKVGAVETSFMQSITGLPSASFNHVPVICLLLLGMYGQCLNRLRLFDLLLGQVKDKAAGKLLDKLERVEKELREHPLASLPETRRLLSELQNKKKLEVQAKVT